MVNGTGRWRCFTGEDAAGFLGDACAPPNGSGMTIIVARVELFEARREGVRARRPVVECVGGGQSVGDGESDLEVG